MNKKIRNIGMCAILLLWIAVTLVAWFGADQQTSLWERRPLQQKPALSGETLLNGSFMEKFDDYALDQFPARNGFRTMKSLFSYHILQMQDNNGIYLADGYAGKLDYPLNAVSVSHALKKCNYIYNTYLKDTDSQIYMTVIPDKNYYLTERNGYPTMDYNTLFANVQSGMPWAEYVDITRDLSVTDYYRTDTHWRQENLTNVANTLCNKLEIPMAQLKPVLTTNQFYGVYYGQAALPMKPDDLYVMDGAGIENCYVYNHETKSYGKVYDTEKLSSADPYEVYLSGAQAILTVENPDATTDKELILFRDSFGSSLAPYFLEGYRSVTLVDIRYVSSVFLGTFLDFHGQDVLFAYSTLLLNNSSTMK